MDNNNKRRNEILKENGYDWSGEDYDTYQEVLKNHFRHWILSLSRVDAWDDLIYMYDNFDSIFDNVDMLDLIEIMMSTYAKTKSMDEADKAGSLIADNSNHGVAKRFVAYLSKEGRDYVWDFYTQSVPEMQESDDSTKDKLYDEFCCQFKDELEEYKKSTKVNSRKR